MKELDGNGLHLCKYQGEIFEESTKRINCSSLVFCRRFQKSKLARLLDYGGYSLSLDVDEAFQMLSSQFGESDYGKDKYPSEAMFWLGYIYRYISYTRECPTKLLLKLLPAKVLIKDYYVCHTQDEEWCLRSWCERFGLSNDDFDKKARLKRLLLARYASFL